MKNTSYSIVKKTKNLFRYYFLKVFGAKHQCNICGWNDTRFIDDEWHQNSICPNCSSQIRQRLFVGILQNSKKINFKTIIAEKKILHFAPDKSISKILKSYAKTYNTADFLAEGYEYSNIDYNIDISNMTEIKDNEYDCLIAFDVLEHVPNHKTSIKEINRVLKKGGYCILTVPQKDGLKKTIEDLTITDPKEREKQFGQWDHLRIYGTDFKQMLSEKGFEVFVLNENDIDNKIVKKNILFPPVLSKHPLATNYRKIYFGKKL